MHGHRLSLGHRAAGDHHDGGGTPVRTHVGGGYENFTSSCITSFGIYTEILSTWEEFPETEERTRENLYKATGREFVKPREPGPHTSDVIFHHRGRLPRQAKRRLVNVHIRASR